MTEDKYSVPFADYCWPALHAYMGDITPSLWNDKCQKEEKRERVLVLANERRQFGLIFSFYSVVYEHLDWVLPLLPPWPSEDEKPAGQLPENTYALGMIRSQAEAEETIPQLLRVPGDKILWALGEEKSFNLTGWDMDEVEIHYRGTPEDLETVGKMLEKHDGNV